MFRSLTGGFALALLVLAGPVSADDKKDPEEFTVWTRALTGVDLKFEIGPETARYHLYAGDNGCIITSKVKYEKDVVTSEITDVEVKGNFPLAPKKGEKFSFKWVVKGDAATLSDLKGENAEDAKNLVEGEYKLKK